MDEATKKLPNTYPIALDSYYGYLII